MRETRERKRERQRARGTLSSTEREAERMHISRIEESLRFFHLCWLHVLGAYTTDCHDNVADFDLTQAFCSPTWRQGTDHQATSVVSHQEKPKAAAAQWLRLSLRNPLHRGTVKFESSKSKKAKRRAKAELPWYLIF